MLHIVWHFLIWYLILTLIFYQIILTLNFVLSGKTSASLTFDWYIENGFDTGEFLAVDAYNETSASWDELKRLYGYNSIANYIARPTSFTDVQNSWTNEPNAYDGDNNTNADGNVDNVKIVGS